MAVTLQITWARCEKKPGLEHVCVCVCVVPISLYLCHQNRVWSDVFSKQSLLLFDFFTLLSFELSKFLASYVLYWHLTRQEYTQRSLFITNHHHQFILWQRQFILPTTSKLSDILPLHNCWSSNHSRKFVVVRERARMKEILHFSLERKYNRSHTV